MAHSSWPRSRGRPAAPGPEPPPETTAGESRANLKAWANTCSPGFALGEFASLQKPLVVMETEIPQQSKGKKYSIVSTERLIV